MGSSIPYQGSKPCPPALEGQSPKHWTSGKSPGTLFILCGNSKSPATWWLQPGLSWDPQNLYRIAAPCWVPVTNMSSAHLTKLLSSWFPRSSAGHPVQEVSGGSVLPGERSPGAPHWWKCSVSASSTVAALHTRHRANVAAVEILSSFN